MRLRSLYPETVALTALAVTSCTARVTDYQFVDDPTRNFDDLESSLEISPTTLGPGESALLVLTLSNAGSDFMQLQFPERRQVGFAVYDSTGELYFTDVDTIKVPRIVALGALESWAYEIEWDGAVEMGGQRRRLPTGTYEVQVGLRRTGDAFVNRTERVKVEIVGD